MLTTRPATSLVSNLCPHSLLRIFALVHQLRQRYEQAERARQRRPAHSVAHRLGSDRGAAERTRSQPRRGAQRASSHRRDAERRHAEVLRLEGTPLAR